MTHVDCIYGSKTLLHFIGQHIYIYIYNDMYIEDNQNFMRKKERIHNK
jgi:hypothetical protein